jgi:hypothetical protein
MLQIFSTDRNIMAAQDMMDALSHHHHDAPFTTIVDDTIIVLTSLADIFKNKFQNPSAPQIAHQSPLKAAENKRPAALIQPVIRSPSKDVYQTLLNTQIHPLLHTNAIEPQNAPQHPRVVAPKARSAEPQPLRS